MDFPDPAFRKLCSEVTLQSSKDGFFLDFARSVTQSAGRDWLEQVFEKQKTDLEKIQVCLNNEKIKSTLEETFCNMQPLYREKSAEAAVQARLEGDKYVKLGDFKKAVMFYSQSIIRSPGKDNVKTIDEGQSLILSLRARASTSMLLNKYEHCLKDIQLIIEEGHPVSWKCQLYSMMGTCYKELGEKPKAKLSYHVALTVLQEHIKHLDYRNKKSKKKESKPGELLLKEKADLLKKIAAVDAECVIKLNAEDKTGLGPLPEMTGPKNEKYVSASGAVGFKYMKETGRYGVATQNIETGATLIVEEPYASCLLSDRFSSHCHHCFSRLYNPVPCKQCSGLAFCTATCRDIASNSYHKYECRFMGLVVGSGMSELSHLALRIMTQSGLGFFKKLYGKIEALKVGQDIEPLSLSEEKYVALYNLVTLSQLRLNEDSMQRCVMALFLTRCLRLAGYFGKEVNIQDETLCSSLIFRHLQLLQFNGHEIFETLLQEPDNCRVTKTLHLGVGVYTTAALLNHDCNPVTYRCFHGRNLVIISSRPIQEGDAISENYGPVFTRRTLFERNRELSSRYWFHCTCQACVDNWPTLQNLAEDDIKLRCTTKSCRQIFKPPKNTKPSNSKPQCQRCLANIDLVQSLKRASKLEKLFQQAITYRDNGNHQKAWPLLTAYLDEIHQIVSPPYKNISLAQDALRTCLLMKGNHFLVGQ